MAQAAFELPVTSSVTGIGKDMLVEVKDPFTQLPSAMASASEMVSDIVEAPIRPKLLERTKYVLGSLIVAAEVSPINEAIRGAVTASAYGATHSPIASAIAFGASTTLIEGAAAVAATPILKSDSIGVGINKAKTMVRRLTRTPEESKFSKFTHSMAALIGGSAVRMALKSYEQPDISARELRSHGLKTSLALGSVCTAIGLAGPDVIEYASSNPNIGVTGLGAVVAVGAGNKIRKGIERRKNPVEKWEDTDRYGLQYGVIEDSIQREQAAELEQVVWNEKEYGDLREEGYTDYFPESQVIAAYEGDKCIGMTRMFRGTTEQPPVIKSMPFYSEEKRKELGELYLKGDLEELGTAAVAEQYRGKGVNARLWRIAYRDARARGVKYWGIVMEPERVQNMNEKYGFTFEQLGEPEDYQGGDCAAHLMDLEEVNRSMRLKKPITHYWFVRRKLRASDK